MGRKQNEVLCDTAFFAVFISSTAELRRSDIGRFYNCLPNAPQKFGRLNLLCTVCEWSIVLLSERSSSVFKTPVNRLAAGLCPKGRREMVVKEKGIRVGGEKRGIGRM